MLNRFLLSETLFQSHHEMCFKACLCYCEANPRCSKTALGKNPILTYFGICRKYKRKVAGGNWTQELLQLSSKSYLSYVTKVLSFVISFTFVIKVYTDPALISLLTYFLFIHWIFPCIFSGKKICPLYTSQVLRLVLPILTFSHITQHITI